ncbi:hypothetical protein TNIN_348751 [Trichonephila inaurata madagascariensis]|uniref:Uncharacterized protein n=1 Tax=Trichonephila inaurata madagascariensis TaxID=2747483 RepID=A0A8X6MJF2_9ARAC|nr:hypothetical protein TNIN_348751 [Trichonephila inaurata madagascariensis]
MPCFDQTFFMQMGKSLALSHDYLSTFKALERILALKKEQSTHMEHVQPRLADDFQPGSLQPCVVPERQTIGQCMAICRWVTEGMLA